MPEYLLSTPIAEALGWTLVNFIWQGAVVAVFLGAGNLLMRRSAPQARYRLASAALLFMVLAAGATFRHLLNAFSAAHSERLSYILYSTQSFNTAGPTAPVEAFIAWVDQNLAYAVIAWSVGVLVLSVRLAGGWFVIRRLKSLTLPVTRAVQARVDSLTAGLSMSAGVEVLSSALVHVPMVVGWVRPVILLPVSALTGLPIRELEALIAHELGHIKRLDYLVNALQTVVETVFFYHPAVWWVSRRIRIEREHCCDDLALQICGDPKTYANALLFVEELCPGDRTFSLQPHAVAASDGSLLSRVGRIVKPGHRPNTSSSRLAAGLMIVLVLAGCSAASRMSVSPVTLADVGSIDVAPFTRLLGSNVDAAAASLDVRATPDLAMAPVVETQRESPLSAAAEKVVRSSSGARRFAAEPAAPSRATLPPTSSPSRAAAESPAPPILALERVVESPRAATRTLKSASRFALGISGGVLKSANSANRPLSPNFEARGILDLDPMTSLEVSVSYSALRDSSTFRYTGPDGIPVDLQSDNEKQIGLTVGIRRAASDLGTNNGFYYGLAAGLLKVPINRVIGTAEESAEDFTTKLGYFILPKVGFASRRHSALSMDISTGLSFSRSNGLAFVQPMISMGLNYWL